MKFSLVTEIRAALLNYAFDSITNLAHMYHVAALVIIYMYEMKSSTTYINFCPLQ